MAPTRSRGMGLNCILPSFFGKLLTDREPVRAHCLLPALAAAGASDWRRRRCRARGPRASGWPIPRQAGGSGLDLRGWAARNAALVGGLEHCHGAGRTGGACRDEGDQCPLLWRAWRSSAFSCFCTIRRGDGCKKCNVSRVTVVRNVAAICSYCSQDLTLASHAGLSNKNHRSSLKNVR